MGWAAGVSFVDGLVFFANGLAFFADGLVINVHNIINGIAIEHTIYYLFLISSKQIHLPI
jgi:hypothetical protein